MRCVIEKEQFIKGLTMVSKAIPQKAELPILSNVKLDLCEKGLVLIGSDNNIIISTVVPYMIDEKEIIRNAQFGETCVQFLKLFVTWKMNILLLNLLITQF